MSNITVSVTYIEEADTAINRQSVNLVFSIAVFCRYNLKWQNINVQHLFRKICTQALNQQ